MNRPFGIAAGVVCTGIVLFVMFSWLSTPRDNLKEEIKVLASAEQMVREGNLDGALSLTRQYSKQIEKRGETAQRWLAILLEVYAEKRDGHALSRLFDFYPEMFAYNEKAALVVANLFVTTKNTDAFELLRAGYKEESNYPGRWILLEADLMAGNGRIDEAIQLLENQQFEGKQETDRLIRLAYYEMNDEPKKAWDHLSEAAKRNPSNPDINLHRAKLLEKVGKPELAITEYLTAVERDPNNSLINNDLAEYFQRQGQHQQALLQWEKALSQNPTPRVWLNAYFWNRAINPIHSRWTDTRLPEGQLTPLLSYLSTLPSSIFWDETEFERHPDLISYFNTEQSTFWLQLIQMLKEGKEEKALAHLKYDPFHAVTWEPELHAALTQILHYRQTGQFSAIDEEIDLIPTDKGPKSHPFFNELQGIAHAAELHPQDAKLSDMTQELILSDEAFSAAFLAAGWSEAALQLQRNRVLSPQLAPWYKSELTTAYQQNRGNLEALRFATIQKGDAQLNLTIAEIMLGSGNPDGALAELKKLTDRNDEIGTRAAHLKAKILIDRGAIAEAKNAILVNPKLASDVRGQELFARIAMIEGNNELADRLYANIEEESTEAKSYLARRAFTQKNWTKARQLTEELLQQYPSNVTLRDNLEKIAQEKLRSGHPRHAG